MYNVGISHRRVFNFFKDDYHSKLKEAGINFYFMDMDAPVLDGSLRTLITASIPAADLDYYPNLEAVFVPFAAVNQLDLGALKRRNIRVFNTSAHAPFVAERALALTLAVLGKIVFYHKGLEKGDWADRVDGGGGTGIQWTSLFGKKVGIYGYGRIGEECHKLLKPFNVKTGLLNYKDRPVAGTKTFGTLTEMAEWCDILIITAPLNESTKSSVNTPVLSALNGKVLVNVGRGPIIDEEALFSALKAGPNNGGLKGFGCDVWYNYPDKQTPNCAPSQFPIGAFNHVVMTPHNGGTEEGAGRVKYTDVAQQVIQISKGDYSRQIRS